MPGKQLWRWHGVSHDGQAMEGALWAESRPSLTLALAHRHITPIRIKRMCVKTSHWRRERSTEVIGQLATLLKAGLTLCEGLTLLAEQHPSSQWQALLRSLADDMEQGISLSTSLARWQHVFPPLYQTMIRTGNSQVSWTTAALHSSVSKKISSSLPVKLKKRCVTPLSFSRWQLWSCSRCCTLSSLSLLPSIVRSILRYRRSLSG